VVPSVGAAMALRSSAWNGESRALAKVVSQAATEGRGETRGGLLWLEHLNIVVGDRAVAERFYFEKGLGCTRDPSRHPTKGTMWANLGSQQFHLAEEAADDPPQAIRGAVGLALPDLDAAHARLEALAEDGVEVLRHDATRMSVSCPWGNLFHCYAVEQPESPPADVPKMVAMHAGTRFDVRGGPGIRYLLVRCADAHAVADAYEAGLGNLALRPRDDLALVAAGLGPVHFVFQTAPDDPDADAKMRGVHACVYVNDFASYYDALRDFVFTNPRFRHLDTCDTLEEALASRTFRFAFPAAPALEHETRSLLHANFLKPLKYDPL